MWGANTWQRGWQMRLCVAAMAAFALANATVAYAQTTGAPYDIMGTRIAYNPRGGCIIWFELTNGHSETLKVSADVFITSFDDVTVGDAALFFPPAVPGGKSQASATFYSFKLANGDCPRGGFKFTLTTKYCELVGSSYRLSDRACIFSKEFRYAKKQP